MAETPDTPATLQERCRQAWELLEKASNESNYGEVDLSLLHRAQQLIAQDGQR